MVDRIRSRPDGSKLLILAPIVREGKVNTKKNYLNSKKGFQRVKIDGDQFEFDALPILDKKKKHDISVVVDRISLSSDLGNRLAIVLKLH